MISIIGIGSSPENMSIRARKAIKDSEVIITYKTYVKNIEDLIEGKEVILKGMGDEIKRAELAIQKSKEGKKVALISSGDPGVFGMGNVLFQVIGKYSGVEVEVIPGVTAATYAASLLGAPLHDFAVVSLSDILTPISEIKRKVRAAAEGDFIITIYNPLSKTRTQPFEEAYKILLEIRNPETPVGIVRSTEDGVEVTLTTLKDLKSHVINMSTTLVVGNSMTYVQEGYMITPRGYRVSYLQHELAKEFYTKYIAGEGQTGPNESCEYYPCHNHAQNCTFCYCPFYPCGDGSTGGKWIKDKDVWSCQDCEWIHQDKTVECIQAKLPEMLTEVDDLTNNKKKLLKLRRECIYKTK
ncbi:precorrin-3B C(17)-methyltransferase [Methanobacterium congolense]|uniref:Putative cobalt-factor III C(17)-methyltransferase n=1 Tax=Methanobacterium congolense TaxID=118062 RepID=A0A1D3L5N9_9EURY|nr:precorrin-3B C(17)-methyltransferase [Methanobacterium congolense]SCG86869.1 putative cobalt-factor III C(17)-methyltransferase [Methanobacterium congolense]